MLGKKQKQNKTVTPKKKKKLFDENIHSRKTESKM